MCCTARSQRSVSFRSIAIIGDERCECRGGSAFIVGETAVVRDSQPNRANRRCGNPQSRQLRPRESLRGRTACVRFPRAVVVQIPFVLRQEVPKWRIDVEAQARIQHHAVAFIDNIVSSPCHRSIVDLSHVNRDGSGGEIDVRGQIGTSVGQRQNDGDRTGGVLSRVVGQHTRYRIDAQSGEAQVAGH